MDPTSILRAVLMLAAVGLVLLLSTRVLSNLTARVNV